ncbi:MAG: TrkA family potassium uptake protein [Spirochaetia bacterium]|nr:TrkA family potassium uptake protein [Spirochaetia bacterium]
MRVVILGCGRLGLRLAAKLTKEGNRVVVIDKNQNSLHKLDRDFSGEALQGDGVNMEIYQSVFSEKADVFFAVTNSDNTNIMAAEIARQKYKVEKTIARIGDPIRAKAFEELGIETVCPTTMCEKKLLKMISPVKPQDREEVD